MKRLPSVCLWLFLAGIGITPLQAQLFDNLRALGGTRYSVGDPSMVSTNLGGAAVDGPKDIEVADLDGDGRPDIVASDKDGSVTVRYGVGDGTFSEPTYLRTWITTPLDLRTLSFTNYYTNTYCDFRPTNFTVNCYVNGQLVLPGMPLPPTNTVCFTNFEYGCVGNLTNYYTNIWQLEGPTGLRGLALADFSGDGRRDIAVASPGESLIYVFLNRGAREFEPPILLRSWFGARELASGDFDGDGRPDLVAAGSTNGLVQYRALGNGAFQVVTNLLELASDPFQNRDDEDYEFPQPAYYLKAVRQPGDTRDELIVSYAQRGKIWILRAGPEGRLDVSGDLENVTLTALDAGPLFSPATNGAPLDLVTSFSRSGSIDIYAATNLPQRFTGSSVERYYVPGAPRNVRIADLDQDGWNDLVVVAQRNSKVLTYRNEQGRFSLIAEALAGMSPREMDLGDFNGDSRPDLAVLNRTTSDVSVFLTSSNYNTTEIGFLALDSVYPVDGGVSGLELRDVNRDGRADVVQLHRTTSEFSVRLTGTNGQLGPVVYYAITNATLPAAQSTPDVNNDGLPDLVSANLSGSVTVRMGLATGGFGPERTFKLPADENGSLFALVPGDFNGDGNIDLAAGYLDCRVSFFQGDGKGTFVPTSTQPFIYEPRSMATADVDQDGDLDLIGGSWMDRFVIVENTGDLLHADPLKKTEYGGFSQSGSALRILDQNGDGDPDLVFGTPEGFSLWLGGPGLQFFHQPTSNDPGISGATFVNADLDGDGDTDIASICATNSCLGIQTFTNGNLVTVLRVPVPATLYLAAGDLDGDGLPDLVGSGDVLWVALSSRRASNAPPSQVGSGRDSNRGVVINEVLAQNTSLPVSADGDRNTDWVEIYNGAAQPVSMAGWRLLLVRTSASISSNGPVAFTNEMSFTNAFTFPSDAPLQKGGHQLVVCSDRVRTIYHSGFNLPAEGALLLLLDSNSNEVDRVNYVAQDANTALARYSDGARTFIVNTIPSPGAPNVDNGVVNPILSFSGVDFDDLKEPSTPLRFRATARDDVGVVNVSLFWRRLDIRDTVTKRVILYDDGMNEDGPANDGRFLGVLRPGLPWGAQIQFYLECTDLTDQVVTTPGNPQFVLPGEAPQTHTLALDVPAVSLEISEIVANNATGLTDEGGGRPDWVEIRNTGTTPVSLAGVGLAPKFFGDGERLSFTNRPSLAPGEHLVVFADSKPTQGPLHAPFRLNRAGEKLVLTGTTSRGARFLIDSVEYGPQPVDTALARLGARGPWVSSSPTPNAGNVNVPWRAVSDTIPGTILFAFPTLSGRTYTIEYASELKPNAWAPMAPVQSTGVELTIRDLVSGNRFFRVREQ